MYSDLQHFLGEIPSDCQALIFDCDGTLADTMPLHLEAWQETIKTFALPFSLDDVHALSGMPTFKIVQKLATQLAEDELLTIASCRDRRALELLSRIQAVEPVLAVALHFQGKLPMAVVSGGIAAHVQHTLEQIGASRLFTTVLTADDPFAPKPAPDLFLEAARRLAAAPEACVVFEDADAGIAAARTAGMSVVDVRVSIQRPAARDAT